MLTVPDGVVESVFENNTTLCVVFNNDNTKISWYCKLNEECSKLNQVTDFLSSWFFYFSSFFFLVFVKVYYLFLFVFLFFFFSFNLFCYSSTTTPR